MNEECISKIILLLEENRNDTEYLIAVYTFAQNYPHTKCSTEKE